MLACTCSILRENAKKLMLRLIVLSIIFAGGGYGIAGQLYSCWPQAPAGPVPNFLSGWCSLPGNDISEYSAPSAENCTQTCLTLPDCVAVEYRYNGSCSLKWSALSSNITDVFDASQTSVYLRASCQVTPPRYGVANYVGNPNADGNPCFVGICNVTYSCNETRVLAGSASSSCVESGTSVGTLSPPPPTCRRVDQLFECSMPSAAGPVPNFLDGVCDAGGNDIVSAGWNVYDNASQCAALCLTLDGCIGFEYYTNNPRTCFPKRAVWWADTGLIDFDGRSQYLRTSCNVANPLNGVAQYPPQPNSDGNPCFFGMCNVTYSCNRDFALNGSMMSSCVGSGLPQAELSPAPPTCILVGYTVASYAELSDYCATRFNGTMAMHRCQFVGSTTPSTWAQAWSVCQRWSVIENHTSDVIYKGNATSAYTITNAEYQLLLGYPAWSTEVALYNWAFLNGTINSASNAWNTTDVDYIYWMFDNVTVDVLLNRTQLSSVVSTDETMPTTDMLGIGGSTGYGASNGSSLLYPWCEIKTLVVNWVGLRSARLSQANALLTALPSTPDLPSCLQKCMATRWCRSVDHCGSTCNLKAWRGLDAPGSWIIPSALCNHYEEIIYIGECPPIFSTATVGNATLTFVGHWAFDTSQVAAGPFFAGDIWTFRCPSNFAIPPTFDVQEIDYTCLLNGTWDKAFKPCLAVPTSATTVAIATTALATKTSAIIPTQALTTTTSTVATSMSTTETGTSSTAAAPTLSKSAIMTTVTQPASTALTTTHTSATLAPTTATSMSTTPTATTMTSSTSRTSNTATTLTTRKSMPTTSSTTTKPATSTALATSPTSTATSSWSQSSSNNFTDTIFHIVNFSTGDDRTSATSSLVDALPYLVLGLSNGANASNLGYQLSELLIDCAYNGQNCPIGAVVASNLAGTNGNCFTFSSGPRLADRAGQESGLYLAMNISQDDYLETTQAGGLQMVAHNADETPFPDAQGVSASPGFETIFSLRMSTELRLNTAQKACINRIEQLPTSTPYYYAGDYSPEGCIRSTLQSAIVSKCLCGSPNYALPRDNKTNFCGLDAFNCVWQFMNTESEAIADGAASTCPQACKSRLLSTTQSMAKTTDMDARAYCGAEATPHCIAKFRRDVAVIRVFLATLSDTMVIEEFAMGPFDLVSRVGGAMGILLGMSMISVVELILLLFYGIRFLLAFLRTARQVATGPKNPVREVEMRPRYYYHP